jgi:hypothetical protein
MDRNKIILIVILALIVVLYIVFVVYGSVKGDKEKPQQRRSSAEEYEPDPSTKGFGSFMGNWFGRFLPKAKIPGCPPPHNSDPEFLCKGLSKIELDIPSADATFRVIKVLLASSRDNPAEIEYIDIKDSLKASADRLFPDGQKFALPDVEHKEEGKPAPIEQNIIILEKGGKLKISCPANSNCKVDIK